MGCKQGLLVFTFILTAVLTKAVVEHMKSSLTDLFLQTEQYSMKLNIQ